MQVNQRNNTVNLTTFLTKKKSRKRKLSFYIKCESFLVLLRKKSLGYGAIAPIRTIK